MGPIRSVSVTPLRLAIVSNLQRHGDDEQAAFGLCGVRGFGFTVGVADAPVLLGSAERRLRDVVDAAVALRAVALERAVAFHRRDGPPSAEGLLRGIGSGSFANRHGVVAAVRWEVCAHGSPFNPSD